jgi:hypothetical protein
MSDVDMRIVAIALIFSITYGTFLYMNMNEEQTSISAGSVNSTEYNTPDSSGFFDTLNSLGQMQDSHPEIFFINTMLFGVIAVLLIFVGLRFLRGV